MKTRKELKSGESFSYVKNKKHLIGKKSQVIISNIIAYIILLLGLAIVILPLFWIFLTSIKPTLLAYKIPPEWIFSPTLENYKALYTDTSFFQYFLNSTIVATVTTLISIVVGSLAAYSIARFDTGGEFLRGWIFNNRTMPPIVILIPIFLITRNLGIYDTHVGLIIPYLSFVLPFTIWMMISFFQGVPKDMEEAALVDGANLLQVIRHIIIPISAPGIAATGILSFLFCWNEFLFALVLTGRNTRTLPIVVANFLTHRGVDIGGLSAATMIIILPVIILAFSIRRFLVSGLSLGAIK